MDTRLAALLRGSEVLPACGIPHHRPVRFDLLAEGAVQSVVKLVRLPRVVIPPLPEEERIPLVQSLLDPLGPRWHAELAAGDVDRLWSTWTWAAEETLLALSVPKLRPGAELPAAPRNYKRGRGTVRLLKRVRLCPRQRRTTGDPVACPEARLQAVQGSLRTVLGWLERPDPRPGAAPRLVMEAWYALQRRLQRVHALGDEYAALQVPDPPDRLPPAAELRGLRTALQGRIRTERQRGDKDRLQAWRDWLDEAWSSKQGAVYKWLKGESFAPPVTFLVRPDGTPTANLREMDSLLQDAWRPINCKYAAAAEPDPAEFLRRYGRHVRCVPMISGPLTGRRLRRALMRMHPSALGLDGWSLEDLRALPDQLLEWLADLLREVERQGRWPLRLAEGYTALIPKEGPPGPLNTRPLTVLSMVYRLWAGIRLEEAIRWQEAWAHPCAFGFRPARSALDGATVTQVLLELCRLKGWAVAGMSIDYVKCFDLIPQAVVLALALELGMDPGVARALGAMYKQLRRAFKVAGCLGAWWRATNGILQGCPLSVILVNVLTTIWKWEVDALREQVCVATATLPPALVAAEADSESDQASQHSDSAEESELHLRLQAQGPGMAALGASGYADDTQAVAPGTAALQRTAPTTEAWLTLTGQDVRVDKSCSWSQGEGGAQAVLLRGLPIPAADCFRQLGVDVAVGGARSTGPVLARRLEAGRSVLRRLPHLPTFRRRVHAVSTLVTPLSLHGVAVAPVTDRDLKGLETMVLQAVWGATRLSRAKEVVFVVLTQGHRISPVMHTRYERVLWMTRIARTPGPVQVLVQAIWESGLRPPTTGPFGRALHVVRLLGWQPLEGWWSWIVPGQTEPLHLVQEPMRQIQHRVRDSLRCHAMRGLEARRPATYGGLGDGVDGEACRAALRVASTELEASLLRGLLAGALWTAARVRGHNMRATSSCPGCGSQHEDEAHALWDCPSWETARAGWRAWVLQAAERLQLGPPTGWPACLRRAGLLPLALSAGADRWQVDEFLYRLYGMYLAVLAARYAHTRSGEQGQGEALFPRRPAPGGRGGYPWQDLSGPLPQLPAAPAMRLRPGVPPGWPWEPAFAQDLVRWAAALRWQDGPGDVTWAELALDCETFLGRALPASPHHRLRGMRLPLGERAQVLRQAARLLQRHMAAGRFLQGAPSDRCRALVPLGGRLCAGLRARPFFAARADMALQLQGLALHLQEAWLQRLRTPARIRPGGATRFLMTYFPRPPGGGPALLPYARRPRREHVPGVARVEEQRPRRQGEGRGSVGARCAQHGSPSCRRCLQLGWGISRCCRAGHEGHTAPGQAPPQQRRAPGRQVLAPAARQAGASALSAWLGRARPASAALPAPERPLQRARRLEPRRLARQAPSPDRDVVPASRRARRASPPRPAVTDDPPPPSPQGTAALGLQDVFCSISAALLAQGGRRPRPHCGPEPPPLPTGQAGQAGQAGPGAGPQGTANGAQHQGASPAQRAAHSAQHHDSAHALPAQSTAHSTPQDAAHSAPQGAAHGAPQDAAHRAPQDSARSTAHSAAHSAAHSTARSAAHSTANTARSAPQDAAHSTAHSASATHSAAHSTAHIAAHSAAHSATHSAAHSAAHSTAHGAAHSAARAARRAQGPGRPGPLRQATLFSMGLPVRQPPPTHRPPGAPDAVAPASPGGMSMPNLAHGRASSEET